MATHKSAEKRDRQNKKHRVRNVAAKSAIKTKVKTVIESVNSKNKENSIKCIKSCYSRTGQSSRQGFNPQEKRLPQNFPSD